MRSPDVNLLVYAHREDQLHGAFYRSYLEDLVNSAAPFALSSLVAVGFLRIVTRPRFVNGPTPMTEAMHFIETIIRAPGCHWLLPGPRHWELTRHLCMESAAAGKRVADAQHAAVAIEFGCTWITRDRDFLAFEPLGLSLEVVEPAGRA
jgi:toxin-antitoxin system PIN domain toxin